MLGMHLVPSAHAHQEQEVSDCEHQSESHNECSASCATCLEKGSGVSVLHTVSVPDGELELSSVQIPQHQDTEIHQSIFVAQARSAPLFESAKEHASSLVKRE